MGQRGTLIAGNWKMNGLHRDADAFIENLAAYGALSRSGRQLLICPPATLIALMAAPLAGLGVRIGGQNCHAKSHGAFTGDLSAAMLKDLGCGYVIVGHSERRGVHGETSAVVRAKAQAAYSCGLIPIICVGESWAERQSGQAERIVGDQVADSIPEGIAPDSLVVAYEPIWAIGSGRAATLDDISAMHHVIRDGFAGKTSDKEGGLVLYGGSVKPDNAKDILGLDLVDGALIGGASLNAGDFMAIADSAAV